MKVLGEVEACCGLAEAVMSQGPEVSGLPGSDEDVTPLRVSVLATDPLDESGAAHLISRRPELTLRPLNRIGDADVLLVLAPAITADLLRNLRTTVTGRGIPIAAVLERMGDVDLLTAVEVGLRGVVWRSQFTPARFAALMQTVGAGNSEFPREVQSRLVNDTVELQRTVLTPRGIAASGMELREVEVLALIAEGLSTAEIAEKMQYSERTVKNILSGVLSRLKLRNRTHAVAHALRSGIL
jgi:DNA-binding NarL/FixJ family response regulator